MRFLIYIIVIIFSFINISYLFADATELGPFKIIIIKIESFLNDYSKIILQVKNISNDYIETYILTCVLGKDGTILNYEENFINDLSPGDDILLTYIIKESRNSWNQIGFRIKRIR